jgi:hypothetical protein
MLDVSVFVAGCGRSGEHLLHLGQFFGEQIPADAGATGLQQPREIDRSLADSLGKADRTVLGAKILDGGDTPVGATIAFKYENIGRSACSSPSDCRSVPPVAAISTGTSDSVSSGNTSKNDLNSPLNEALKAG